MNYCKDIDKQLYIDGNISSSELYKRRNATTVNIESLEDHAKRLKDDSESQLTYAMITDLFKVQTESYIETLVDYVNMVDSVTDKRYTRDEAITDITLTFDKVVQAVTSLKGAIIDKSNTIIMEE